MEASRLGGGSSGKGRSTMLTPIQEGYAAVWPDGKASPAATKRSAGCGERGRAAYPASGRDAESDRKSPRMSGDRAGRAEGREGCPTGTTAAGIWPLWPGKVSEA